MGREQERIKKKLEENPIEACNKIQTKMYPELFAKFAETKDPRNQSYITYSNKIMLGTLYYKGIAGIASMQTMTYEFNNQKVVENLARFMDTQLENYLPHHVTENEYLERLKPGELEEIQKDMVYQMVRRKSFDDARFMKKWLVIVDGTELYSGKRKLNDKCLERHHNKDTEKETVNYYSSVLEAKIFFGDKLLASIGVEFIENNSEDALRQRNMNAEEIKQDCETKAFIRLAEKIKKRFPRLPIILMGDSLYASKTVMDLCKVYHWDYIIRFKDGKIPSIAEEYEAIPEKETAGHTEYINGIDYKDHKVNVLRFWEDKVIKGESVRTNFQWLTSIRISEKNAQKVAAAGRKRWKIENEGFNRQKNWQGDITHICSWNEQAQKNHYIMAQISDFMKQLYEYYYLKQNDIKKKQKKISSDLLESFAWQLTSEDISRGMETHGVTIN
jgi:hypothetical protein